METQNQAIVSSSISLKAIGSVSAICLGWGSSYWVEEKRYKTALSYLLSQPTDTQRLFVFKSPQEANLFKNVLNEHNLQYGQEGRVFFCSATAFSKIIKKVLSIEDTELYLNRNFGVLTFEEEEQSESHAISFDDTQLEINQCESPTYNPIKLKNLFEYINKHADLGYGELDGVSKICRWSNYFVDNTDLWAETLKEIFKNRKSEAFHIVLFKNSDDLDVKKVFQDYMFEMNHIKESLLHDCGMNLLWFGETILLDVNDFNYKGKLKISNDYPFAIIVKFNSKNELELFYENKKSSKLRGSLYSKFNDALRLIMGEMEITSDESKRDEYYNIVEKLANEYMLRLDFNDTLTFEDIAEDKGYIFELPEQVLSER